jgi:ELWxxDGT repeat protein
MFRFRDLATAFAAVAASTAVFAGPPRLVRDINSTIIPVDSSPSGFTDQTTWSMFDVRVSSGIEQWGTDGTAAGTVGLGTPGNVIQYSTLRVGGNTYFFQTGAQQTVTALWRSNGTRAGTHLVADFAAIGTVSDIWGSVGNAVIFQVQESGRGRELWRSDGTESGTYRFTDFADMDTAIYARLIANGRLYFVVDRGGGEFEFWVSDGTTSGTRRLSQIPNSTQTQASIAMTRVGRFIFANLTTTTAGGEIWRIDLDNNDAVSQVADIAPGTDSGITADNFGAVNGLLVFTASSSTANPQSLWRSDGTAPGTFQIANLSPISEIPRFEGPTAANRLVFRVANGLSADVWSTDGATATQLTELHGGWIAGRVDGWVYMNVGAGELWRTDGTAANTRRLTGLPPNLNNVQVTGAGSLLFVRASALPGPISQWRYDVATDTATLLRAHEPSPNGWVPDVFSYTQGRLYFDSRHPITGHELWISDGTIAGTQLLRNIATETRTQPSEPRHLFAHGGILYFTANDGISGRELWRSDGTPGGTQLVLDIAPGTADSDPISFFVYNDRVYFFAYDGGFDRGTYRLWTTDGTAAGTTPIVSAVERGSFYGGQGPCGAVAVTMNANAYLSLWEPGWGPMISRTDGTAAGTVRIREVPGTDLVTDPCYITAFGDSLFFSASQFGTGSELFKLTPGATPQLVADIRPGSQTSEISDMRVFGSALYFLATSAQNDRRLWRSDGTAAGTIAITDANFQAASLVAANNLLFFHGSSLFPGPGAQIYTSDGTAANTAPLTNVFSHTPLHSDGRRIFFGVVTGFPNSRATPWVSDGTILGTYQLPGTAPNRGVQFWDFNGSTILLARNVTGNSVRLFRTDGTTTGTALLGDAGNVPAPIWSTMPRAAGQNFFYVADNDGTGLELYAVDNGAPVATDDAPASVQAGQPLAISVLTNDSDADGTLMAASVIATQPANGTVIVSTTGLVTYTANASFAGNDQFTYTVADTQGARSAPAIVRVTVTAAPASPPPPPPSSSSGGGVSSSSSGGGGGGGSLSSIELLCLLLLAGAISGRQARRVRI